MNVFFVSLIAFLAIVGHSNAAFCVCKDGVSEAQLQKTIDYACSNGADCTSIAQNGACYNPNTVKDHCSWAVNSYYQKKGQAALSCDFSGTATVTSSSPSQSSSCVYPSGPGNGGSVGTPTTGTPPSTGGSGSGTGTSTGSGTGTSTGNGTGSGMGTPSPITTVPGNTPGSYGLAPSGTGLGSPDSSAAATLDGTTNLAIAISLAILSLSLMFTSA
ncbi:hypothetical protein Leryth_002206 [Lithospermum erythrorhizon]|nr:hypothetical protein Leryth_002206 [Lithospermum erythrorhizon]